VTRASTLPLDRPDLIQAIAEIAADALGSGCLIRPCSADGRWLESGWVFHPDQAIAAAALNLADRWPQPIDQGICGQVASSGEPFYARTLGDLIGQRGSTSEGRFRSEFEDRYALLARSSLIVVPIFADSTSSAEDAGGDRKRRVIGTFALTRDEPLTPFQPEDVAVVQDLVERLSPPLRHGFLLRRLRETEDRCRELVGQGPGIAYVCGAQPGIPSYEQVSLISPQVWPLLGYTQAEWLADPSLWAQALHPEVRDRVLAEVEAVDATG
jgi:GAF domain-containing protein